MEIAYITAVFAQLNIVYGFCDGLVHWLLIKVPRILLIFVYNANVKDLKEIQLTQLFIGITGVLNKMVL